MFLYVIVNLRLHTLSPHVENYAPNLKMLIILVEGKFACLPVTNIHLNMCWTKTKPAKMTFRYIIKITIQKFISMFSN